MFYHMLFLTCILTTEGALFKLTKVDCQTLDKDFVSFSYCRLKAIKRGVSEFSFKLTLHQGPVYNCLMNIEILRKYTDYRPFLFNYTIDPCDYLKRPNKYPLAKVIQSVWCHYTNFNHTCPYDGDIIMEKFAPTHSTLSIPLPSSDYQFVSRWVLERKLRVIVRVWFTFEEVELTVRRPNHKRKNTERKDLKTKT